jgi:hypothetical protein
MEKPDSSNIARRNCRRHIYLKKRTSITRDKRLILGRSLLALSFLLVEIYLLGVRRSGDPKQQSDRGTLRVVWVLITRGCLIGFWLAPKGSFLNWPDSLPIVLFADLLVTAEIGLRIWGNFHLGR